MAKAKRHGQVLEAQTDDPKPSSEELLDAALASTFPASDPIAVDVAYVAARSREQHSQHQLGDRVHRIEKSSASGVSIKMAIGKYLHDQLGRPPQRKEIANAQVRYSQLTRDSGS